MPTSPTPALPASPATVPPVRLRAVWATIGVLMLVGWGFWVAVAQVVAHFAK